MCDDAMQLGIKDHFVCGCTNGWQVDRSLTHFIPESCRDKSDLLLNTTQMLCLLMVRPL